MSSLPYSFNTESFTNIPSGSNLGFFAPSTSVIASQYTIQQGANAIYYNKSTMDAYYAAKFPTNPPVAQFKSDQDRLAALIGKNRIINGGR